MKKEVFSCLAAAIALILVKNSAVAQTDSLILLDAAVVTATFSEVQASNTGRNILVISGDQVANLPVNSVDELLRFLPGIEMQMRGPMGVQSDISIRGATFQQVLVIVDGLRLNDPLTGHFNGYIPIAPGEIERIEVMKGASSAIYGSEAVGGVIHIITKTFARSAEKSDADVQFTYGEYNLRGGMASGRWVKNKSMLSAGVIANHSTGQPQRGTNGFFNLTSATIAYAQQLDKKWTLSLRSGYDYRSFSAQNFYTTLLIDTATETIESWWQNARAEYRGEKISWTTDLGYKWLSDVFALNSTFSPNENKTGLFQGVSRVNWEVSQRAAFTGGLQFFNRSIQSNDRGNHGEWQAALFAVLHYRLAKGLFVDPAIRLDQNERSGFNALPQVNVSYRKGSYQLRGSAGASLRDADFTERFNNYNRERVISGRIGNPSLAAEKGANYELGADVWLKGLKISTTGFLRSQNNLIDWVSTPYAEMPRRDNLDSNGNYLLANNIWEVNTLGAELDLQYVHSFDKNWALTAQSGILWVQNKSDGAPGIYLAAQARWLINGNLLLRYKFMELSLAGLYKTREPRATAGGINATLSDEYFVMNVKLLAHLHASLDVFIQADNIGDIQYSDILGAKMPGRWLMAGVRYQISAAGLKK